MWTIYHGCLDYYAVKVLYSCIDGDVSFPSSLDATLTDLLALAYKSVGESPHQIYRCAWPLAVALLKIRDPIHRDWIQAQLKKAQILLSNLGLPTQIIDRPIHAGSLFLEYNASNHIDASR